jgi:hypothetical protein
MNLPNKQMLIAHASHWLRRENACAFSRAKFGSYVPLRRNFEEVHGC